MLRYILHFIWDKGTAFCCDVLQRPHVYQFFPRGLLNDPLKIIHFP